MRKKLYVICLLVSSLALLTACGDDDTTQTSAPTETGTWTDERDNTTYGWVRYGNLDWTTENLSYLPAEGETQPDITPVSAGSYDDGVASSYYAAFGLLYDHEAALAAVPDGWRLPTQADWDDLSRQCGGDIRTAINLQLGGYYLDDSYFQQLHDVKYFTYIYGFYWTADTDESKTESHFAYYRKIVYNQMGCTAESMNKSNYLSVRLVRDAK